MVCAFRLGGGGGVGWGGGVFAAVKGWIAGLVELAVLAELAGLAGAAWGAQGGGLAGWGGLDWRAGGRRGGE